MELKRSNNKAFETLANNLKELANSQSKVGWFQSATYPDGTKVAYVAAIQELGSAQQSIPPRPFMRPTAIAKKNEWSETAADGAKEVVTGNASAADVMEALGLKAGGDVLQAIVALDSPALSPVTIELRAMKKRNPNLVITGATVGEAAAKIKKPGYVTPNVSVKPLNDSGLLIATLTSITENNGLIVSEKTIAG